MNYYKRIEKREFFFENAPIAPQKNYKELKANKKVITAEDECGEFLLVPTSMVDEFVITSLSRADIKSQGFDADKLSDEEMQDIADQMEDEYIEYGGYWESLEEHATEKGCRQIHRNIETAYGEVMLKPIGNGFLEVYQGDNFDEYVGEITESIDADEEELIEKIENLFN